MIIYWYFVVFTTFLINFDSGVIWSGMVWYYYYQFDCWARAARSPSACSPPAHGRRAGAWPAQRVVCDTQTNSMPTVVCRSLCRPAPAGQNFLKGGLRPDARLRSHRARCARTSSILVLQYHSLIVWECVGGCLISCCGARTSKVFSLFTVLSVNPETFFIL